MTGETDSSDFPTTPGAFDRSHNGYSDAFGVWLNTAGSTLDYATFLGGSASDGGGSLALDAADRATVTGYTDSSDFPTTPGAFDRSLGGIFDAFIAKLAMREAPPPTNTPTRTPTRTPTATPTSTPTLTATPLGPWASWVRGDLPLLMRR